MWQNSAIAVIQLALTATLWPTIRDRRSRVSRKTSVPCLVGLFALSGIFVTLDLWTAAGSSFLCASAWTYIALYRPIRQEA